MAVRTPSVLRQHVAALPTPLMLTVGTGVIYPLVLTGVAQLAFPGNADGSLVRDGGTIVGSDLIGQSFTHPVVNDGSVAKGAHGNRSMRADPRYFQSRPSAAGTGYDPLSTSASNLS